MFEIRRSVPRDAALVCIAGGVRAAAVSLVGVIVAIHLAGRGLTASGIGLIIGVGIASSAAGTVITALRADRWGRRRTLIVLGLLTGAGWALLYRLTEEEKRPDWVRLDLSLNVTFGLIFAGIGAALGWWLQTRRGSAD